MKTIPLNISVIDCENVSVIDSRNTEQVKIIIENLISRIFNRQKKIKAHVNNSYIRKTIEIALFVNLLTINVNTIVLFNKKEST